MGYIRDMILKTGRGISIQRPNNEMVVVNGVAIDLKDVDAKRDSNGLPRGRE